MNDFLFYLWSIIAIFSAIKVITSKNPISSVFWLVLVFATASMLLILLGLEFLPMLLIIIYLGAIAILFLFVVMLLNIKLVEINENTTRYAPTASIIGLVFLYELSTIYWNNSILNNFEYKEFINFFKQNNVELIGQVLYTEYWVYFLVSSLILLVAMIGAILLCLFHEENIKRQDLFASIATDFTRTIKNVN